MGALAAAEPNPDVEVLFRLSKTANVKTEKGINSDIIRFNNSQNVIRASDFRSNDTIQYWLERKFAALKPDGAVPKLRYSRKRGRPLKGPGRVFSLEEFAKIRYSFLIEPTLIHEMPKSLWTNVADGGHYEWAFGVNGEMQPYWSEDEFQNCLVALIFL